MSSAASLADYSAEHNYQWARQGLERTIHEFEGSQAPHTVIGGRRYLQFSTSDYLGLSRHPAMANAAIRAIRTYGTGSGGSRLTTGTSIHSHLEHALASTFAYPKAVFFATGYQTNLSAIATVAHSDLTIFSDAGNHASLIDGIRMARQATGCSLVVFPHLDYDGLVEALARRTTTHALVVSDGVFSMSGEVADSRRIRELCDEHGAWFMLDDAHGVGTMGPGGIGSWCGDDEQPASACARPDILVGTASKALGVEGGFVLTDEATARLLRNQARGFVFSTSSPPATIAAITKALELLVDERWRVEALQDNTRALRKIAAEAMGARASTREKNAPASATPPIVPMLVGAEDKAMALSNALKEHGIFCSAIRYPTVPRDRAILRFTSHAELTRDDLDRLRSALVDSYRSL